ncbi:hypothetical protein [Phormidium sp. CLA17]|uniref:hypothetical protein n=1 Tax=Leptolyngbya sp. Cla-17 TaxID=2803751 RepID=UPI001A931BD9
MTMMIINVAPFAAVSLAQVIKRILGTGTITHDDEVFFQKAMLSETPLDHEEMDQVTKVYYRLQMGLLKVVD